MTSPIVSRHAGVKCTMAFCRLSMDTICAGSLSATLSWLGLAYRYSADIIHGHSSHSQLLEALSRNLMHVCTDAFARTVGAASA